MKSCCNPIYLIFLLCFCYLSKKSLLDQGHRGFFAGEDFYKSLFQPNWQDMLRSKFPRSRRFTSIVFFCGFYSFSSYIYAYDPVEVNFCVWCEEEIKFHSFAYEKSQHHLLKRVFFLHLNSLGILAENQLTVDVWVYFWIYSCIPLFILMLVPHCFDYCSFVVSLGSGVWVLRLCHFF